MVDLEAGELVRRGINVSRLMPSSDDIVGATGHLFAAAAPFRSERTLSVIEGRIDAFRPHLLHLHNLYPLVPAAVIALARRRGIPVVLTLHNARFFCMKGTMTRKVEPCLQCLDLGSPLPGVVYGCYRGSRLQSSVMGLALRRSRPHVERATRYLTVSAYLRDRLVAAGLPAERTFVKPNGVPDPGDPSPLGRDVLYVGRLDEEKGISFLLDAWADGGPVGRRLLVVGSGRLEEDVRARAASMPTVDVLGFRPPADIGRLLHGAGLVVVPSQVPETFGLTAVEAFAAGRPVAATRLGALVEVVDDTTGWLFDRRDELATLLGTVQQVDLEARGRAARRRFIERYTMEASIGRLLHHYEDVLAGSS